MTPTKPTPGELPDPLVTLKKEAREKIDSMAADIEASERLMSALDELGIDVTADRERLDWAKRARQVILDNTK